MNLPIDININVCNNTIMKLNTLEQAEGLVITTGRLKTAITQAHTEDGQARALALLEKINTDIDDLLATMIYVQGGLEELSRRDCEKCGIPVSVWTYGEGTEFERDVKDICIDCSFKNEPQEIL